MLTNYNFNPHPDPPEVFSSKPLPPWGETGEKLNYGTPDI
jgi:hypothetical protein